MDTARNHRSGFSPRGAECLAAIGAGLVRRLIEEVARNIPADAAVARFFKEHRELGSRDRRFLSELVFSFFRWRGWLASIENDQPRKACAIAYYLDAFTEHPAAEVLARDSFPRPQPVGESSMDNKARAVAAWLDGKPVAQEALLPAWVRDAIPLSDKPQDGFRRCVESFQRRPPTWIHLLNGRENSVLRGLAKAGIRAQPHPHIAAAAHLPGSSALRSLPADIRAGFIIQDLASQCVALACDPKPAEQWWDVCAGAGGKAIHLADLMRNRGDVLGSDIRPGILDELRRRVADVGVRSVHAGEPSPGMTFDGVLVDAPCSGLGTWSRNPDARWRTPEHTVVAQAEVQLELLMKAADRVRPDGVLVYSVCTLTTRETADVVAAFLERDNRFEPEPVANPLAPDERPEPRHWIWPWEGPCDGMFIARFRRRPD